jgi:glucose/arabinose dehydrogenase
MLSQHIRSLWSLIGHRRLVDHQPVQAQSFHGRAATATNSCQAKNRQPKIPGDNPCTELETRGGVWRYDANKTNQISPAKRYATGIRNAEGFAFDSTGRLFVT